MPEAKKTNTLIEKTILVLKTLSFQMKNGTAPSYKMPEAKKTNTFIEKNNSGVKNSINSYEKTAQHRLTKCPRPKKQTLSLKKQFWS